ncbi:MAG: hypothetical protein HY482_01600 [Candidatus Wildermuthbacteria bacterium]|nr:hypothetical protein [Candidatus Wildermuthbacteria bacterium]
MAPVIIASSVLVLSFVGAAVLVGRKMKILLSFPAGDGTHLADIFLSLKEKIRSSKKLRKATSPEFFLQMILSRARVFVLRAERGIARILEGMRKKSQEKDQKFTTDYWGQLRKKKSK